MAGGCVIASAIVRVAGLAAVGTVIGGLCAFATTVAAVATTTVAVVELVIKIKRLEKQNEGD